MQRAHEARSCRARRPLALRSVWLIVFSVGVLGGAAFVPRSFADSEQMEDRDRSLDWALGGLEQGSRIPRPAGARAPAGSRTAPGSKVSPADAGTSRPGREAAGAGVGVRSVSPGGAVGSNTGAGRQGSLETSRPSSSGGETQVGGGGPQPGAETGGTGGTGETTSGGGTTDSGLGIHVEADTSGGELKTGVQVDTTDTSLDIGTGVETGVETGSTALGGQVDATTDTSDTTLVGSAELTSPDTIDTSTATELDSTLSGGGNDATVESDAEAEAIGDDADDCSLLGLIDCPSFP